MLVALVALILFGVVVANCVPPPTYDVVILESKLHKHEFVQPKGGYDEGTAVVLTKGDDRKDFLREWHLIPTGEQDEFFIASSTSKKKYMYLTHTGTWTFGAYISAHNASGAKWTIIRVGGGVATYTVRSSMHADAGSQFQFLHVGHGGHANKTVQVFRHNVGSEWYLNKKKTSRFSKFIPWSWNQWVGIPTACAFAFLLAFMLVELLAKVGAYDVGISLRFFTLPFKPADPEYLILAIANMLVLLLGMLVMLVEMMYIDGKVWLAMLGCGVMLLNWIRNCWAVWKMIKYMLRPLFECSTNEERERLARSFAFADAAESVFARFGGWFGGLLDFHMVFILAIPSLCCLVGPATCITVANVFRTHALMHIHWMRWTMKGKRAKKKWWVCQITLASAVSFAAFVQWCLTAGGIIPAPVGFAVYGILLVLCSLMFTVRCHGHKADDCWEADPELNMQAATALGKVEPLETKNDDPTNEPLCSNHACNPVALKALNSPKLSGWETEAVCRALESALDTKNTLSEICSGVTVNRIVDRGLLSSLQMCFRTRGDWLGKGRDINAANENPYSRLALKAAWRLHHGTDFMAYQAALADVERCRDLLRCKMYKSEVVSTADWPSFLGLSVNASVNEVLLVHGLKANCLGGVLSMGLNERYAVSSPFGAGAYFAEDLGKSDQYCEPQTPQNLDKLVAHALFAGRAPESDGVCFIVICRVVLGQAAHTKNGETRLDGGPLWADATKRELATIRDSVWPLPYQSVVVDTGDSVVRYREFVQCHCERVYGEFLVAFERHA
eukprot:TRINITY_DN37565_c0_g1_i1.p1 TRINITY_DN37565_c0_g1~~TRINITY_DN37565_c0_g1_i1.p1  ORF type:complete len:787 (-),score=94.15 TRINITY_DN37565_c0_g1_i1:73-2433(-)